MLTFNDFITKIEDYRPTVYDAAPDLRNVKKDFAHRAYTGAELYYHFYKLIYPAVKNGSKIMDIGVFPGTFLRLCKQVFFKDMDLELAGLGLNLPGNEFVYRDRSKLLPQIDFVVSDKDFKGVLKTEDISFTEYDLDYCFDKEGVNSLKEDCDILTCMEVIEHLHTPYKMLNTAAKCLKPGGIFLIETNNAHNINGILKLLFTGESNLDFELARMYIKDDYTTKRPHLRFYSIRELSYMLHTAGFVVENAYSFNWDMPSFILKRGTISDSAKQFLKKILPAMIPGRATHIMVKAKKPLEYRPRG